MLILKVFLAIDLFLIIFIMLNKIAIYKIFLKIFWNNTWQIVLYEVQWRQQKTREEKIKKNTRREKQKSSEHGGRSNGLLNFTSRKSLNEFT